MHDSYLNDITKKQGLDAHERVRKLVAKEQRHLFVVAKCESLLENLNHEGVRNSHFVLKFYIILVPAFPLTQANACSMEPMMDTFSSPSFANETAASTLGSIELAAK